MEAALDSYVVEEMERRHIPGLAVAILQHGRVLHTRAYGTASSEWAIPATVETVYPLASLTKPFTAVGLILLVEEGRFTLDDTLGNLLPSVATHWSMVRVRHLLSHTSGIKNYIELPEWQHDDEAQHTYTASQVAAMAGAWPNDFTPGERWDYNQMGYVLLGLLVEQTTGQPFATYMDERLFRPLEMTRTCFGGSRVIVPHRNPVAVEWCDGVYRNSVYDYAPFEFPAAGLNSTVVDVARWMAALERGVLLTRAHLEEMWTAVRLPGGTTVNYGLGWALDPTGVRGHASVGHEGGGRACLAHYRPAGLTVIALAHARGVHIDTLVDGIAGLYLP